MGKPRTMTKRQRAFEAAMAVVARAGFIAAFGPDSAAKWDSPDFKWRGGWMFNAYSVLTLESGDVPYEQQRTDEMLRFNGAVLAEAWEHDILLTFPALMTAVDEATFKERQCRAKQSPRFTARA